jgi:putative heme-binding domain-containing protein
LAKIPAAEKKHRAVMGLQVFERNACTKCHTTATQTTLLAPSLKGIGGQKVEYLIESVLFPSKVIKTGFEAETVNRTNGKIYIGLVKEDGDFLRVLNQDFEVRIPKKEVESRTVSRVSIMPEGQEQVMSRREFVDLIAYLATLK